MSLLFGRGLRCVLDWTPLCDWVFHPCLIQSCRLACMRAVLWFDLKPVKDMEGTSLWKASLSLTLWPPGVRQAEGVRERQLVPLPDVAQTKVQPSEVQRLRSLFSGTLQLSPWSSSCRLEFGPAETSWTSCSQTSSSLLSTNIHFWFAARRILTDAWQTLHGDSLGCL